MRAPRQGQVDVELVETVGDDPVAPAEPAPDWRALVRRVPRRAWAVTAGVVAVAVGLVGAVEWRADRAQAVRLAGTVGLTVPLTEPLTEVWRAPRSGVVGVVGDVVVLNGGSSQGAVGVGADDGATRWERADAGSGWCWFERLGADGRRGSGWAGRIRHAEPGEAVLGCADFPDEGPGGTEVTVVDPVRGEVLRRFELTDPGTRSTFELDDGVATFGVDDESRVVAARWDLLSGAPVWEYTGPVAEQARNGMGISHDDTTMTLTAEDVMVTLDVRTGEVVDTAGGGRPVTEELDRLTLADGGVAVSSSITTAIDEQRLEVVVQDEDGAQRFTTAGHALRPVVDDGSAPRTLLLTSPKRPGIMAVDARTGDELWRSRVSSWQVVVLAGLVVLRDEQRTLAVDARTGVTVWSHDDPAPPSGVSLLTDGRVLLIPVRGRGRADLLARDAETGRELWRAPAPSPETYLDVLPDGRVLVMGSGETVVLAP